VALGARVVHRIEVIDAGTAVNELILNDIQDRYIKHFISRVEKGGSVRYLLNGEPGTGKTETIREIIRTLIPEVTFIVPEFDTSDDLMSVLEACEIFDKGVIIMDDIDLYLGSRQNGSYTRLLGQFLSFFDGVKKRKISLLASTNDKGLVDKAAERPGRFNFTLDYTFLDEEQIIKVCNIHLPEKWKIAEVYEALNTKINGKKVNITGAFIANLAENIKEMSEDDEEWGLTDTVNLIIESYKGFYSSQSFKEKESLGFIGE
jgi:SpoVK/Ycf46/Vps4 family AAA+-type ATPase